MLPFISFHTYQLIYQCSEHGVLPGDQKICLFCEEQYPTQKRAKVSTRNKIVSKSIVFPEFFELYYLKHLKLYKKHRFLFIILSKNHIGGDRESISDNKISSSRDFAERLSLQFQGQS